MGGDDGLEFAGKEVEGVEGKESESFDSLRYGSWITLREHHDKEGIRQRIHTRRTFFHSFYQSYICDLFQLSQCQDICKERANARISIPNMCGSSEPCTFFILLGPHH